MKTCSSCRKQKDLSCFRSGTKSAKCKECLRVQDHAYYNAHKQKWVERDKRLREEDGEAFRQSSREAQARYRANPNNTIWLRYMKARYGITIEQYSAMFDEQKSMCAICNTLSGDGKGQRLHVDHDHATGKVRQLLCFQCNRGLGAFKDDLTLFQRSMDYLKKHRTS